MLYVQLYLHTNNENKSNLYTQNDHFLNTQDESYTNQLFDLNKSTIITKVGSGSFGEVFKAKNKETGSFYAVKVILKSFEEKYK